MPITRNAVMLGALAVLSATAARAQSCPDDSECGRTYAQYRRLDGVSAWKPMQDDAFLRRFNEVNPRVRVTRTGAGAQVPKMREEWDSQYRGRWAHVLELLRNEQGAFLQGRESAGQLYRRLMQGLWSPEQFRHELDRKISGLFPGGLGQDPVRAIDGIYVYLGENERDALLSKELVLREIGEKGLRGQPLDGYFDADALRRLEELEKDSALYGRSRAMIEGLKVSGDRSKREFKSLVDSSETDAIAGRAWNDAPITNSGPDVAPPVAKAVPSAPTAPRLRPGVPVADPAVAKPVLGAQAACPLRPAATSLGALPRVGPAVAPKPKRPEPPSPAKEYWKPVVPEAGATSSALERLRAWLARVRG